MLNCLKQQQCDDFTPAFFIANTSFFGITGSSLFLKLQYCPLHDRFAMVNIDLELITSNRKKAITITITLWVKLSL